MNNKLITLIRDFSYSLSSNLISMIISAIVVLIVPKLLGIEDYGYWQLYLFYSSYVGFLHFGWNDGIYLRYGGKEYKDLDKDLFFSQFWMLCALQLLLGMIIFFFSIALRINDDKEFIFNMIALCTLLVNVRFMLIYILQGTNRIKEYAQTMILEKVLYCCLILLLILVGIRQYKLLIVADIAGKLVSLLFSAFCCRDLVFKKVSAFYLNLKEAVCNIRVGIKLMFANIASNLIIGTVRFGIERTWNVSTFGKISLIMNISNLMMIFINSLGIIMFPILRRTNEENLPRIYTIMRTLLMVSLLGLLVIYYPLKMVVSLWLPQYSTSLVYMSLVFPICVFEGKMSLLINTYLKTLRREKLILFVNITSVFLGIILTFLFTVIFKVLMLSVSSIVVLLAFRCAFAEICLSKILKVSIYRDILLEIAMSLIFILIGLFVPSWIGVTIYIVAYGLYLIIKRKEIIATYKKVKQLVKW